MNKFNLKIKTILQIALVLVSACALVAPECAEAASVGRAVTRSVSRKLLNKAPVGKPKDVVVHRSQYPQAAEHIEAAQRNGQPTVLHIDRNGAAARRTESTGNVNRNPKPRPATDRDEYPPAFTREGGSGASVRFIDAHDNRGAGSNIRAQTGDLPDGAKIRVLVTD
jgi:filamentous hemagglutinin